ncbi:hypothetical protein MJ904_20855 [Massilia sp. MB5]|uniref:hypothetical protein n=1 Tax=Massilia sp. MB5 TaxID=2919578 RepID=UPI001F0F785B|nr:hypothetical protein [Massilia sp. MB5]UMR29489.1 hypothetical protein MJ904_20855 [Massilia sp. MB5]
MNFTILQTEGILLTGNLVGNTLAVDYTAMLYEQPADNNCFLSLWQDTQVPFGKPGDTKKGISGNQRTGSVAFTIQTTNVPYVVGWGAGNEAGKSDPNYKSIGASLLFTPGTGSGGITPGTPQQCQIQPALVGVNSIVVQYTTLFGNNPKKNGNWIGLWLNNVIDFSGGYLQKWDVGSEAYKDSQGLNTTQQLLTNTVYTLAYATGSRPSDIVALCTFQTAAY